jgi:hypothetical protein
MKDNIREK